MLEKIILLLSGFITSTIAGLGYGGIVLLMGIESACIPLPSEIIMPFSGYLVFKSEFTLWGIALAGAIGCVLGSLIAYFIGAYGGRSLVYKYGSYVLISHRDLNLVDRWFERHGGITVFVGRLLPVIRTFIALPAGMQRTFYLIHLVLCAWMDWFQAGRKLEHPGTLLPQIRYRHCRGVGDWRCVVHTPPLEASARVSQRDRKLILEPL